MQPASMSAECACSVSRLMGESYGREMGMEELYSHEEDPGSKGWRFLLWSVISVEKRGSAGPARPKG